MRTIIKKILFLIGKKKYYYTKKERLAIKKTINHWTDDHKKLIMFGGEYVFHEIFRSQNCNCCKLWYYRGCLNCPIVNPYGCNSPVSDWNNARESEGSGYKSIFMNARSSILMTLKAALVKEIG